MLKKYVSRYMLLGLGILFGFSSLFSTSALAYSATYTATTGGTPNVAGTFTDLDDLYFKGSYVYTNGSYYLYYISTGGMSPVVTSYISTSLPSITYNATGTATPDVTGDFTQTGIYNKHQYWTNGSYYLYTSPTYNCTIATSLSDTPSDYFSTGQACYGVQFTGDPFVFTAYGTYTGTLTISQTGITMPSSYFIANDSMYEGTYSGFNAYSGTLSLSEPTPPTPPITLNTHPFPTSTPFALFASVGEVTGDTFNSTFAYMIVFMGVPLIFLVVFNIYHITNPDAYKRDRRKKVKGE